MPTGPLPASGAISFKALGTIKSASPTNPGTNISLSAFSTTNINPFATNKPGATAPHILTSWYNYVHGISIQANATFFSNGNTSASFSINTIGNQARITAVRIDYYPSWISSSSGVINVSGLNNTSYSVGTGDWGSGGGKWYDTFSPDDSQFAIFDCFITGTFGTGTTQLNVSLTSPNKAAGSGSDSTAGDSNTYTI